MKNCNATLIAYPRKKKFHFPVEAIKSSEVAEWINGAQIIRIFNFLKLNLNYFVVDEFY